MPFTCNGDPRTGVPCSCVRSLFVRVDADAACERNRRSGLAYGHLTRGDECDACAAALQAFCDTASVMGTQHDGQRVQYADDQDEAQVRQARGVRSCHAQERYGRCDEDAVDTSCGLQWLRRAEAARASMGAMTDEPRTRRRTPPCPRGRTNCVLARDVVKPAGCRW